MSAEGWVISGQASGDEVIPNQAEVTKQTGLDGERRVAPSGLRSFMNLYAGLHNASYQLGAGHGLFKGENVVSFQSSTHQSIAVVNPITDHFDRGKTLGCLRLDEVFSGGNLAHAICNDITYYIPVALSLGGRAHWVLLQIKNKECQIYDPKPTGYLYNFSVLKRQLKKQGCALKPPIFVGYQGISDRINCGRFVALMMHQLVRGESLVPQQMSIASDQAAMEDYRLLFKGMNQPNIAVPVYEKPEASAKYLGSLGVPVTCAVLGLSCLAVSLVPVIIGATAPALIAATAVGLLAGTAVAASALAVMSMVLFPLAIALIVAAVIGLGVYAVTKHNMKQKQHNADQRGSASNSLFALSTEAEPITAQGSQERVGLGWG